MIPLALCISSFLVAVTKHDQGNLQKERLLCLMGQRDKGLSWWGNMTAGSRWEQDAGGWHPEPQAGSGESELGMVPDFDTSKSNPSDQLSP